MEILKEHTEYESTVDSMSYLSQNEDVLSMCRTMEDERADFRNYVRWSSEQISALREEVADRDTALAEKDTALAEKDIALTEKDNKIIELTKALERLKSENNNRE